MDQACSPAPGIQRPVHARQAKEGIWFILLLPPSLFPAHLRVMAQCILWSISWRAKRKIMESPQTPTCSSSPSTPFPTNSPPRISHPRRSQKHQWSYPSASSVCSRWYWNMIRWEIGKGVHVFPPVSPFPSGGILWWSTAAEISQYRTLFKKKIKKENPVLSLFLVLFFCESNGCSCLGGWYENKNIS